jgi:GPH family glycoside/pentoside/hexuronide:cation symporter
MANPSSTKPTEKLSTGRKLAYGIGAISENTMQNAVGMNANQFFNVTLQVAPGLLGIAAMIFRLWDAITDPIMGWISDRTEAKIGRRRPYIIGGALAGGVLFALIWWCPRGMDSMFYLYWYIGISLLFYTAFTVFGVPYLALGYEMSSDYHERTRIMSFRTWFQSVSGICIQWMFWATQRDFFEDTVEGMRWVGVGMGLVIMAMGVAPGIFLRERQLTREEHTANRETVKLKHALGAFNVRPFRYVLAALALSIIGLFTVGILGAYINIYYLYGGDVKAASVMFGWQGTAYHLCCMASIPLIAWTSARIGKKNALMLFLSIAVVGTLLKWVLFTPSNP